MYVLNTDPKHARWQRRFQVFQLVLALLSFLGVLLIIWAQATIATDPDWPAYVTEGAFPLIFLAIAGASCYQYFAGSRGIARVVLTEKTLALKQRGKPAIFVKRDACIAYGPSRRVFLLADGSELDLYATKLPPKSANEISAFVIAHWWGAETLDALEHVLEEKCPISKVLRGLYLTFLLLTVSLIVSAPIGVALGWVELLDAYTLFFGGVLSSLVFFVLLRLRQDREKVRADYRIYFPDVSIAERPPYEEPLVQVLWERA